MDPPMPPPLRNTERFSSQERDLIQKSVLFAAHAHVEQRRRDDGAPYIVHPGAVAQLLIDEFNADVDTVIAGLLHDAVEDTHIRLDDVEREFGPTIRFLVDGVTDHGENDGNGRIHDKLERAHHSKRKALRYAQQDERVLLVKIADRWDNMRTVHVHTPRGQVGYSKATKEFHVREARRLGFIRQADAIEALCDAAIAKWAAYGG